MKKIVLPFVAVIVCLVSYTGSRAVSATTSSPIAVSQSGNIRTRSSIQTGDNPMRATNQSRTLTFAERVIYQRAIEGVYWHHRIWPKENTTPKLSINDVISQAQIEKKVQDYLRKSPPAPEQLQAEMDRMAEHTMQPEVLRELFDALGNDPFVIAECLARPAIAQQSREQSTFEHTKQANRIPGNIVAPNAGYHLPVISGTSGGCIDDSWMATITINAPSARGLHTAVWTGSEMIVWGGYPNLNTGGKYNPATDTWTATATTNAPSGRYYHTAVWSGREMIIWGGSSTTPFGANTGGRYNPAADTWIPTTTTHAPSGRNSHTAVWTGTEMIVWGGLSGNDDLNTGGRYNPGTNSWTATSTANAPAARDHHTAVWAGDEMIVWGGEGTFFGNLDTGGRYDPRSNSWITTSTANVPEGRLFHTAIWTGSNMIVWGGTDGLSALNTGGKYDPGTNSWTATTTSNAPSGRSGHTAVWNGSDMIVWGGGTVDLRPNYFRTGGRYNPVSDSWSATSTTNAPTARSSHTAVWTGTEMIVWSGGNDNNSFNTGGRYCATASASQLGNISTRAFVQTGDNVMIGGFIVQGAGSKRVIIRAIGPELRGFGVPNALADPTLELHNSTGALIASNDSWLHTIISGIITGDQVPDIRNSGHAPADARESAIIADLSAGNYTAIVRGVNNTMGVGLVEVYDLSPDNGSMLGNISTRSFVQAGDNVMIGGFIVQGTQPKRVILRAIGPELGQFGVPNPLSDPTLELRDSSGALIASNDNWQHTIIGGIITGDQVRDIRTSGHAPTDGRESAIIAELPPGNYTGIVRGVNNITGVGLVEVYDLD